MPRVSAGALQNTRSSAIEVFEIGRQCAWVLDLRACNQSIDFLPAKPAKLLMAKLLRCVRFNSLAAPGSKEMNSRGENTGVRSDESERFGFARITGQAGFLVQFPQRRCDL